MRLNLDSDPTSNMINAYQEGRIIVNGQHLTQSVVIMPDHIITDWPPQQFDELEELHFEIIMELNPEIVLLGTGAHQHFPHPKLARPLIRRRIGIEVMDTAAACRTYNIIMAERRRVAAALLMI